jgi:hypothetical protein
MLRLRKLHIVDSSSNPRIGRIVVKHQDLGSWSESAPELLERRYRIRGREYQHGLAGVRPHLLHQTVAISVDLDNHSGLQLLRMSRLAYNNKERESFRGKGMREIV